MHKHFILFIIFVFSLSGFTNIKGQDPFQIELSDSSFIAVLTCDPGDQLYSGFGHSAIGVIDYKKRLSMVFNYGTFSFNTSNFYVKFAGGKLNYKLSITSYKRFLHSYAVDGRQVTEDRLNLSQQQKQELFAALMENYRPENREYMYDFFFDNCATRILLKLEDVLADSLQYFPPVKASIKTFRNLLDEYLKKGSWSDVGIDLALGSVIDKVASEKNKAFLPDYLKEYLDNCKVNNKPLIKESKILVPDTANFKPALLISTPPFIFWFLFFGLIICSIIFRKRNWLIVDRILFSTIGFFGVIVLLMWFATDHSATANNLNFIWVSPLYLIYALYINGINNKIIKWGTPFFLITNILVLVLWQIIPQQFNITFIPIIGLITLRLAMIFIRLRKKI